MNIKLWDLCEFDCLHFAQYISMSPHGIGCKQTWLIPLAILFIKDIL